MKKRFEIEIERTEDETVLLELANEKGWKISATKESDLEKIMREQKPYGNRALDHLNKIRERGGISSIKDPSEWQREMRKDKPLTGRE